ncbi:MAG: hypothetical protein PSY12_09500 [bacterium]|nr:hypothetical protein [bacterium]
MAFLSLDQSPDAGGAGVAHQDTLTTHPAETHLSALEWQVVDLARTDGLASLRGPGRWAGLHKLIFGERHDPRLANSRLEALRRLAVDAWHRGYAVRPSFLAAFGAAGFTDDQLETLLASINAGRRAARLRS